MTFLNNDVRFRVVGEIERFGAEIANAAHAVEKKTADGKALTLTVAASYGGRWEITQAVLAMLRHRPELATNFTEDDLGRYLLTGDAPELDLVIRTGGEQRLSNFMLWQMAFAELYFTDCLWPDFDRSALKDAIDAYKRRERRFGGVSLQP